jgi:flagellar assembly factor FliW
MPISAEPIHKTTAPVIRSPWIGDVEPNPDCELAFPIGLPGFEDHQRFMPVEIPVQRPLVYLQSVDRAAVCFVALPVYVIDPDFCLNLSEDELSLLGFHETHQPVPGADVLCLALLIPSDETVEANLSSPVVINLHNRIGIQAMPADGRASRFRLTTDEHSERNGWIRIC